ncbi:uncharacterized protein EV420DRAFT_1639978 [Desarmillaria tabescens]|uniref:Decapping nuclease n=1 Tax=Armillaria tabescens TaxID=1929756 RepID=A0AA39TRS6_ARMTA|nr:uncharacterized protein EV420DRAFT_1639978 [Desarmillaria tabescens]KAK0461684.1 hypothetical protein EV420DRAFT_1639978 [Desarmillaria tabescens]
MIVVVDKVSVLVLTLSQFLGSLTITFAELLPLTPGFDRRTRIYLFHEHRRRFRFYSSPGLHDERRWDFQLVPAAEHVSNVFLGPATQVACYSRLDNSLVKYDKTLLRRFRWPAPGRNLTIGAKHYAAQDPYRLHEPVRVDHMLEACLEHGNHYSWLKSDVIATCEALSKVIRGVGQFNVSYISGKLYLESHAWKRKRSTIESYVGGYGFRRAATQLCDPNMLEAFSTPKDPVGVNVFNTVITRTLGGLQLLTAGEIHCVQDDRSGHPNRYIELRCKKDGREPQKLAEDLKKWRVRCHLLGIPVIFFGFRKQEILSEGRFLGVAQMNELIGRSTTEGQLPWDVEDVFDCGFRVLCRLREYCQVADDWRVAINDSKMDRIWRVHMCRSKMGFYIRELTREERVTLRGDKARIGIVPQRLYDTLRARSAIY